MIKYANVPGYANYGEINPFSHFYQFKQTDADIPIIIVLHAYYEGETKAFKGYLFYTKQTFESVPLTAEERTVLEPYVGAITQVDLDALVAGTEFERDIFGYRKVKREQEAVK